MSRPPECWVCGRTLESWLDEAMSWSVAYKDDKGQIIVEHYSVCLSCAQRSAEDDRFRELRAQYVKDGDEYLEDEYEEEDEWDE